MRATKQGHLQSVAAPWVLMCMLTWHWGPLVLWDCWLLSWSWGPSLLIVGHEPRPYLNLSPSFFERDHHSMSLPQIRRHMSITHRAHSRHLTHGEGGISKPLEGMCHLLACFALELEIQLTPQRRCDDNYSGFVQWLTVGLPHSVDRENHVRLPNPYEEDPKHV